MKIIYTLEDLPQTINKSIFLAGPSLRPGQDIESWRTTAIQILQDKGYDGVVFCPENDGSFNEEFNYDEQVQWEEKCLNVADCIVFWIPRDLKELPGFTTNDEFGYWKNSGKVVFGAPVSAEKVTYQKYYAEKLNIPFSTSLTETMQNAIDKVGEGSNRCGGERFVPLSIWKLDNFQDWYKAQTNAGNRLDWARAQYTFRPGNKDFIFLWILHVHVYVGAEDRVKTNEFVLSRTNISSVCLWHKSDPIMDSKVIIVREFRSPANNDDCFVRELVGGSSNTISDPLIVAKEEVEEETGFNIHPSRLKEHSTRQIASTLSSHKCHLYSVELSDDELKWFEDRAGKPNGVAKDSEITYIEVCKVLDLLNNNLVDWSNIGQILSVITYENI